MNFLPLRRIHQRRPAHRSTRVQWAGTVACAVLAAPLTLANASVTQDVEAVAQAYEKANPGKAGAKRFDELLRELEDRVPSFAIGSDTEDPHWQQLRLAAARLARPIEAATSAQVAKTGRAAKRSKSSREPTSAEIYQPMHQPLSAEIAYRFGFRDLIALSAAPRDLSKLLQKGRTPTSSDLSTGTRLRKLLQGCLPESELALATYQRELDLCNQSDELARFLETWRNPGPSGDESFYEALDRTAGTSQEVFFYDRMLAEFGDRFGGAPAKSWNLQEQHDKVHRAFLAYRQYRSFVEAIAFSAVYPSNVRLPPRLADYDASHLQGQYRLRDNLDVLAAAADGDYEAVLAECRQFLAEHPFPADPWKGYTIVSDARSYFDSRMRQIVASTGRNTSELLAKQQQRSLSSARRLRECTLELLD